MYEQLSEEVEKLKVEKSKTIAEYVLDPFLVITVQIMFFALELLLFFHFEGNFLFVYFWFGLVCFLVKHFVTLDLISATKVLSLLLMLISL